jgi:hypothetical protein
MNELLPHIKQHFDGLQDRLLCFREQEVQVEGWFKGEILFLLTALRRRGMVQNFDRETGSNGAKVDLMLRIAETSHWIELKHWLVGVQRGARLDPPFYFGNRTSVGIVKDFDKLVSMEKAGPKWFLILLTGNPGNELWERGLAIFHRKFSPRSLIPRSQPDQFPISYFLGLLQVEEAKFRDT